MPSRQYPQPVGSSLDRFDRIERIADRTTGTSARPHVDTSASEHADTSARGDTSGLARKDFVYEDTKRNTFNLIAARTQELKAMYRWAEDEYPDRRPTIDAIVDLALRRLYADWHADKSTCLRADTFASRKKPPKEKPQPTDFQDFK